MRFKSIHEIPKTLRRIGGTQLSIDQIEALLDEADSSELPNGAALAQAKRDFMTRHTPVGGHWVANNTGASE